MSSVKSKANINIFLIPLLAVIALSIAYYLVVFLPSKEKMRNELEKEKIRLETQSNRQKSEQLQDCLDMVMEDYRANWDIRVKESGRKDNLLPKYLSEDLETARTEGDELCVRKYK